MSVWSLLSGGGDEEQESLAPRPNFAAAPTPLQPRRAPPRPTGTLTSQRQPALAASGGAYGGAHRRPLSAPSLARQQYGGGPAPIGRAPPSASSSAPWQQGQRRAAWPVPASAPYGRAAPRPSAQGARRGMKPRYGDGAWSDDGERAADEGEQDSDSEEQDGDGDGDDREDGGYGAEDGGHGDKDEEDSRPWAASSSSRQWRGAAPDQGYGASANGQGYGGSGAGRGRFGSAGKGPAGKGQGPIGGRQAAQYGRGYGGKGGGKGGDNGGGPSSGYGGTTSGYGARVDAYDEYEDEEDEEEEDVLDAILPILEKRDEIVPILCHGPSVCCIHGETGCGKSTQVPKILLEEAAAAQKAIRIAVTQPRRVAALSLANRVAKEIGEDGVGKTVGYRIGGESKPGEHIDFCTVGYLLQLFINAPDEFGRYTHIVLDEVHERSAESDMLCLVVRLFISTTYPDTRVVVMSATLQSGLFAEYFGSLTIANPPSEIFVGAKRYPVKIHYLDEFVEAFGNKMTLSKVIGQRIKQMFPSSDKKSGDVKGEGKGEDGKQGGDKKGAGKGKGQPGRIDTKHCEKMQGIIIDLLRAIGKRGSTILVFLPGIAEISSLWEEARTLESSGQFQILPLHSMIPREEQEQVFAPPNKRLTRVVLATDIAESSITLPNVVATIDMGLHRRVGYDSSRGISALATKWISQAGATQRSGRAGRTRPGISCRLYPRDFFETSMKEFEAPETSAMPMDKLYLQSKQLIEKLGNKLGKTAPTHAEALLMSMIQAPDITAVKDARNAVADMGVITHARESATITSLGRICLQLPIDLKMARLVWIGSLMGCAADAVVLAAVVSSMDPFASPSPLFMREENKFVESLRASTSARLLFDGGLLSEPLMMRQLFLEWLVQFHQSHHVYGNKQQIVQARRKHTEDFAWHFSLSRGRMDHMISHVLDLALRTYRICEPSSKAAVQLKALIRSLGYLVNDRGDLSGIPWESWKEFVLEEIFETDTDYLKSLMALGFGDQLLLGSYGAVPQNIVEKRPKEEKEPVNKLGGEEEELWAMSDAGFSSRQSAVVGGVPELENFLEFLCGEKPHKEAIRVPMEGGGSYTLVELAPFEGQRWQPLESRAQAPLLDSPSRFPPEFSLLAQWDKSMKDLAKAKISEGWTYGETHVRHPCRISWEWMAQPSSAKGSNVLGRTEAICDRKNALGFVGQLQELEKGKKMNAVAALAVCASIHGGEAKGKAFPTGVTSLSAGHIGFIIAGAKLYVSKLGLRSFGFTPSGSLSILHRAIALPSGCLDKLRWDHIRKLREAFRQELIAAEAKREGGWKTEAPMIKDSPVEGYARALCASVPHLRTAAAGENSGEGAGSEVSGSLEEAIEDGSNPTSTELAAWAVDLQASSMEGGSQGSSSSPSAFWPLAEWDELRNRCDKIIRGATATTSKKRSNEGDRDRHRSRERDRHRSRDRAGGRRSRSRRRSRERKPEGMEIVMMGDRYGMEKGSRHRIERVSSSGEYVLANGKRIPKELKDKAWRFSQRSLEEAADREKHSAALAAAGAGNLAFAQQMGMAGAGSQMEHMALLQQLSFQAAAAQQAMPPAAMVFGAAFGVGGRLSAGPQVEAKSYPWVRYRDGDVVYYYNEETRASTWEVPPAMKPVGSADSVTAEMASLI